MFDTLSSSGAFKKVSSASETCKNTNTITNSEFIPCRGLPATWDDPIVELPQRTRGVPFHLWTEVLPTNLRQSFPANGKPRTSATQMPIGTRASVLADNQSFDDLHSGYVPWKQLKAVRAGTLELKDALPATARDFKTEAWLELADEFIAMRDHETAALCIQNVLATSTARRGAAGSYFPPVPAVLPLMMPSTEAGDETNPMYDCPPTCGANSEDWAVIEVPAASPLSPAIMVEREDFLLEHEEKPVVRTPRPQRFIFDVLASTLGRMVR